MELVDAPWSLELATMSVCNNAAHKPFKISKSSNALALKLTMRSCIVVCCTSGSTFYLKVLSHQRSGIEIHWKTRGSDR